MFCGSKACAKLSFFFLYSFLKKFSPEDMFLEKGGREKRKREKGGEREGEKETLM